DGQTGSVAGPDILPHPSSPVAKMEDDKPDTRRSTAVRTPHMAAVSETPRSAESSVPAPHASRLAKRELLPSGTANLEGRARTKKPEQPAALHENSTPAAPAKTASVSAPVHTGQDQAGIRGTKPAQALGRLPAQKRGTTQDSAPRVGPAVPTPSPGVRLLEGTPQLVVEAEGHTAMIRKLLFTADGHELVSVSDDKTIRVWAVSPDG